MRPVIFIGALPPPVTGMTSMSHVIVRALGSAGSMRVYNWSCGKPVKGMRWKLVRLAGFVKSAIGLLLGARQKGEVLYYPANSGLGLYYDLCIISIAVLRGYRIAMHHHTYSYIDRKNWHMTWMDKMIGTAGYHVVHCEQMAHDFRQQYRTKAQFLFVPPTIVSQELQSVEAPKHHVFTIGFMSNLTLAKGLDKVIDTFEYIIHSGSEVKLILAGPCMGKVEQRLIDEAVSRWPTQVEYRGPVYGEDKAKYFAELDVFLFPTCYKNESWGIVLTEAISVGCPVIAYDRGCVPHIIRAECGLVIPRELEFLPEAVGRIQQWIDDTDLHKQACQQAVVRYQQLDMDANEQLPQFIGSLRGLSHVGE